MNEAPTPPAAKRQPQAFFEWMRQLGVVRGTDAWIGGVCSAIAARTGLDPLIIRGITIVIAILGGPVFLAYAVAWALLPDTNGKIHAERVLKGEWEPPSIAIIVIAALTITPFMRGIWWQGAPEVWGMPAWLENTLRTGWTLLLVGAAIWFTVWFTHRMKAQRLRGHNAAASTGAPPTDPAAPPAAGSWLTNAPGDATTTTSTEALPSASPNDIDTDHASPPPYGFTAATAFSPPAAASAPSNEAPSYTMPSPQTPPSSAAAAAAEARARAAKARQAEHAERQAAAAERNRERQAEWRSRHPGAGFTIIALGLAAIAGGIGSVVATAGGWADAAFVIGGATALIVLGLATILAGLRGRRSGALGGFAFLLVIALVATGLLPRDTQLQPFGSPHWTTGAVATSEKSNHAVIAGGPTLDLSALLRSGGTGPGAGAYNVWLGAGEVDVILPENGRVTVAVNALVGGVNSPGMADDHGGIFLTTEKTSGSGPELATVTIWSAIGSINVVEAATSNDNDEE